MEITKTQYYDLRRGYNHIVNTANILKELPEVESTLASTLHLVARDIWKILADVEVIDDYEK